MALWFPFYSGGCQSIEDLLDEFCNGYKGDGVGGPGIKLSWYANAKPTVTTYFWPLDTFRPKGSGVVFPDYIFSCRHCAKENLGDNSLALCICTVWLGWSGSEMVDESTASCSKHTLLPQRDVMQFGLSHWFWTCGFWSDYLDGLGYGISIA